jgi:hypothetical protein
LLTGTRVTTVEGSDPNGKGQVVRRFPRLEFEVFRRNAPNTQPPLGDLRRSEPLDLPDALRGSVDHEHVPVADPLSHGPCRSTGRTSDFEDPHAGSQRQGGHDLRETRRQRRRHVG